MTPAELRALRDRVAVVGVGASRQGVIPDTDEYGLAAEALAAALEDSGVQKRQVDGLVAHGVLSMDLTRTGEVLGLDPGWSHRFPEGGFAVGALIIDAVAALAAGLCATVAMVYGNQSRSGKRRYGGERPGFYDPWGFTSPGAASAMQARLHFERYGTTSRQLAAVAVAQRKAAMLNPQAIRREPLTVEDHQQGRYICEPLRRDDYCLINDGAVALVLTTRERAHDLRKPPVFVKGLGRQDKFRETAIPEVSLWRDTMPRVAETVYGMAGVGPRDIDVLQIYDSFSINVWLALENFGFCQEGEAGDFTQGGRIELGGERPVNTAGGHLSESYMMGWLHQVEAVRQLRGECGPRQVDGAEVAQFICRGKITTSIVYGR
jgi:acetyl-CoA acetyltransferase